MSQARFDNRHSLSLAVELGIVDECAAASGMRPEHVASLLPQFSEAKVVVDFRSFTADRSCVMTLGQFDLWYKSGQDKIIEDRSFRTSDLKGVWAEPNR